MSDEESIQFEDNESIAFIDEGELDGTLRSSIGRARSRAASMRRTAASGGQATATASAPRQSSQLAVVTAALSSSSSPKERASRRANSVSPPAGGDDDESESIMFQEIDNQSVASSIPGAWFLQSGKENKKLSSKNSKPAAGSRSSDGSSDPGEGKRGDNTKPTRKRSQMRVVSDGDDSSTAEGTGNEKPAAEMTVAEKRRLDRSLSRIADSAALRSIKSNVSIQFEVVDDDDEDAVGTNADMSSTPRNNLQPVAVHQPHTPILVTPSSTAPSQKKTVVSNALRERGASMKGLRNRSGSSTSKAGAQQLLQTSKPVLLTTATSSSSGEREVQYELASSDRGTVVSESVKAALATAAASAPTAAAPQQGDTFPSFSPQEVPTADPPVAPLTAKYLLPSTPKIQHQRTDSTQLVLEHLKEQESSAAFQQHRASLLHSTPLQSAALFPVMVGASSAREKTTGSRSSDDPSAVAIKNPPQGIPSRSAAAGVSPRNVIAYNGGKQPQPLVLELHEAARFTARVRQFNSKQLAELEQLQARLHEARLNDSTKIGGVFGAQRSSARPRSLSPANAPVGNSKNNPEKAAVPRTASVYAAHRKSKTTSRSVSPVCAGTTSATNGALRTYSSDDVRRAQLTATLNGDVPRTVASGNPMERSKQALLRRLAVLVAEATEALGIVKPDASSAWFQPYTYETSTFLNTAAAKAGTLYFKIGVRLTADQHEQFYTTVRTKLKGHQSDDADVLRLAANKSSSPRASSPPVNTFSSHSVRERLVAAASPTAVGFAAKAAASECKRLATKAPLKRHAKKRTEILRNVFTLLDSDQRGVLLRADLPALRTLMLTECDLLAVPRVVVGSARRQQAPASQDAADMDQSLITASLRCKEYDRAAFRAPCRSEGRYPSEASAAEAAAYHRFGCADRAQFRRLCQFAAEIVIPALIQAHFEEFEFPHVAMILLRRHQQQQQPQQHAAMEAFFDALST